jgi:hypothetical protein
MAICRIEIIWFRDCFIDKIMSINVLYEFLWLQFIYNMKAFTFILLGTGVLSYYKCAEHGNKLKFVTKKKKFERPAAL